MLTAVQHIDAGVEQFEHILVALAVLAAGNVGVGKLVNDHDLRMPREDCVDIHLPQIDATIRDHALRYDFEIANLFLGIRAAVCFHQPDHHVNALLSLQAGRR